MAGKILSVAKIEMNHAARQCLFFSDYEFWLWEVQITNAGSQLLLGDECIDGRQLNREAGKALCWVLWQYCLNPNREWWLHSISVLMLHLERYLKIYLFFFLLCVWTQCNRSLGCIPVPAQVLAKQYICAISILHCGIRRAPLA